MIGNIAYGLIHYVRGNTLLAVINLVCAFMPVIADRVLKPLGKTCKSAVEFLQQASSKVDNIVTGARAFISGLKEAIGKIIWAVGEKIIRTVQKSLDDFAKWFGDIFKVATENVIVTIAKNKWDHIFSRHTVQSIIKQLPYINKDQLASKLSKSFFNPEWSDEVIKEAVEKAYKEAIKNNAINKKFVYNFKGDIIEIFIDKDGGIDTAYGVYKYTVDEFIKVFGGK